MKVGILGAATSRFGELWQTSPRQLVYQTVNEAINKSGIKLAEIDAIYVGNMLSGILGNQENLGAFFAEELGLAVPAFKIEGACASGGLAIHNGALAVLSGRYRRVLVIGVEKMTDHKPEEVSSALMGAGTDAERISGVTFPGLYALLARAHMDKFNTSQEDLAQISVKNHYHASLNPKAHFRTKITVEKVLASSPIAEPLKLLDCSPVSDGAAAVVIAGEEIIKKKQLKPVWVIASTVATDSLGLAQRKDLTSLSSAFRAAKNAYNMAGINPKDIDICELHDCFSIAEIIAMEDLGFVDKGKMPQSLKKECFTLGKASGLVVNTSGGLKACGHPVGATGVKQIVEIVDQLRGQAEERQVDNPKIGLTHNVGGSGAVAVVHILRK